MWCRPQASSIKRKVFYELKVGMKGIFWKFLAPTRFECISNQTSSPIENDVIATHGAGRCEFLSAFLSPNTWFPQVNKVFLLQVSDEIWQIKMALQFQSSKCGRFMSSDEGDLTLNLMQKNWLSNNFYFISSVWWKHLENIVTRANPTIF